jgi:hypothetical protein
MGLRSGFIAVFALAACSAAAGNLPCEPSPACASSMTRDLAMKMIQPAGSDDDVIYSIELLEWAQDVDPEPGAAARARFETLARRIGKVSDAGDHSIARRCLGIYMAKAGFIAEATKVAQSLDAQGRNVVNANIAEEHARRGRWREAFIVVDAMPEDRSIGDGSSKFFALRNALKSVARTDKPEFIEEAASLLKPPPPRFVQIGLAWADLTAGRDDAAIQRALQQGDENSRLSLLFDIASWYQDEKRDLDKLRVDRLQLERIPRPEYQEWFDHLGMQYFEGLVKAHQNSQALAWAPQVNSADRDRQLRSLFLHLRKPEEIAAATRLMGLFTEMRREDGEDALTWARIASGLIEPAAGIKSVAGPGEFARSAVELVRDFDQAQKDLGRAVVAAAVNTVRAYPRKAPFEENFFQVALARAQIQFGLLEDARKTIDEIPDPDDRTRQLLALSVAQSGNGQEGLARATKTDAMALLANLDSRQQPDFRADMLLRAGMIDDAEAELRRLMIPNPKPPVFSRVGAPLIGELVKRGEVKRAFGLAADWSALHGDDPEALASLYRDLTNSQDPPSNLSRVLKRLNR